MKGKPSVVLLVCLVLNLWGLNALAQEEIPQGQLFSVHEDAVIPSMVDQYEKATKNLVSLFAKHGITSTSFTGMNTQDFTYSYSTPVENLAGVEKLGAGFEELQKKMGKEAFQAALKQFDGCYTSHRNFLVRRRTDLSYNPEYGLEISEGMNFRHWDFFYIHPGKQEETIEILKEWKALHENKKIAEGYRVYFGDFGTDMPALIVARSSKNAVEYYSKSEKRRETLGEAGQALLKKTWSLMRKFEHKNGSIRPDLSYLPEPEVTAK